MMTPVVLGYGSRQPTAADTEAWGRMCRAAADWYARVTGYAPSLDSTWGVSVPDAPAGPSGHPPTHGQALTLVRAAVGTERVYSIVGLGVGSADGAGNAQGCLIAENAFRAWASGMSPRTQLWLLLHEWGHVAGLTHPADIARTDTIMAYGSTARFEQGSDVGFTEPELAIIRTDPLWEEAHVVDESGWMPGVTRIPANEWGYPDIREDDMWPKAVMNHVMQGFRRTMDDWARSPQPESKSVQFGINRAGEIAQYVSIWNPAYHAGVVNQPDGWGAQMIGKYGPNPNKWAPGIEWEGFSIPAFYNGVQAHDYVYDAAHPWPEAMVQAAIAVHRFVLGSTQELVAEPRKQDRVLTHSQTDSVTRAQDPGDFWIATVKPRIIAALLGQPDPAVVVPTPVPVPAPRPLDARIPQARDLLTAVIDGR